MQLQLILFYTIWILFFIVVGIAWTNYYFFGYLSLNFVIFIAFVKTYPIQIILLISVLCFIIYLQYKVYRKKLLSRGNCQIQFVDLERIAQTWLEGEELEENIETRLKDLMEVSFDDTKKEATNIISTLMGNGKIKDLTFYQKYVFPYLEAFSNKELEIIALIYELLEIRAKTLPSVATIFKDDSDKKNYSKKTTSDKTSYEILSELSLFDHTINVVDNMFNMLIKEKDSFIFVWGKCLITALAHDIGKIDNIDNIDNIKDIDAVIYNQTTHEAMSKFLLSNAFPDYEYIDDVCEIVEKHHIQNLDKDGKNYKYITMLNNADIFARQNEIKAYLQAKKDEDKNKDNSNQSLDSDNKVLNTIEIEVKNVVDTVEVAKKKNINSDENKIDILSTCYTSENLGNIIQKCIDGLNTTEILKASGKVKLISISNGSNLFIPKEIFYKYIKDEKIDIKSMKNLNEVLERFKKDGVYKNTRAVKMNNFVNGAYLSNKEYIVLELSLMGVNPEEADLSKRNEPYLRNVEVEIV